MYKMELKTNEKIFLITTSGFISQDEGNNYLVDLVAKVKTFNNSEYHIIIDTQELKASGQGSTEGIKKSIA